MLGKHFRQCEEIAAGAKRNAQRTLCLGLRRQVLIEARKLFTCEAAVALRQGFEGGLKTRCQPQPADDAVQADYFGASRQSGQEVCAFERLSSVGQRGEASVDTALPIVAPLRDGTSCKAAQIPYRQPQESARPERGG